MLEITKKETVCLPFWTDAWRWLKSKFKKRKRPFTKRDTRYWTDAEYRKEKQRRGRIKAAYDRNYNDPDKAVVNG